MTKMGTAALGAVGTLALVAAAQAAPVTYSWTGKGINVQGASKCPTYEMTVDVQVDGTDVKGEFQQKGRDRRHFEAKLDGKGMFKTKAQLGGGSTMDVSGTINDKETRVLLDGYCKFDAKLMKK
ncbi:MAG TPA: hypothetical protein VFB13_21825 [Reyranella sp.]|nr:hypothetical protein [Reyranella sp.]